jgi:HEAT repeat protein
LNGAPSDVVDLFLQSGTPEEDIARHLGAAHLVVISTTSSDPSGGFIVTPVDMTTGTITGKMGGSGAFDAKWPASLESDAADVADFIKEGLTPVTPAQREATMTGARATVLNAALPAGDRLAALARLSHRPEVESDAVVAAAIELATIAPQGRAHIWRVMYGVDNPYLIQPLIDSLSYDAADHVRRQAATSLRTFVSEPRVKTVLEQAQASDPSEAVREAAQGALSSDEEVAQRVLQKLLDETLPVQERLMATLIVDGANARAVPLTTEAARAVFDIGVTATDADIRGSAWSTLGRNDADDPAFTGVLLDDLARYPDDEVRVMAAYALASYVDDPVVRAALEQAESDASFDVRHAARRALSMVRD